MNTHLLAATAFFLSALPLAAQQDSAGSVLPDSIAPSGLQDAGAAYETIIEPPDPRPADTADTVQSKRSDSTDDSLAIPRPLPAEGISAKADSAAVDSLNIRTAQTTEAPADTTYRLWHSPYFGAGAGWELGSMPLLDRWTASLPMKIEDFVDTTAGNLSLRMHDEPTPYHAAFPLRLTAGLMTNEAAMLTADAGFLWFTKNYRSSLQYTEFSELAHYRQRLLFLAASAGCSWYQKIPREFFSIANVDASYFAVGISLIPWAHVSVDEQFSSFFNAEEHRVDYRGAGASWRLGLSTFRQLTQGRGIEIGAFYEGSWFGAFGEDGLGEVRWESIAPVDRDAHEPLAFMSHRFRLAIALLFGKSRQTTRSSPAGSNT